MKIIYGILIGVGLMFSSVAVAESSGISFVKVFANQSEYIYKYYDYDNNVVCYTNWAGNHGGISCLHN